MKLLAVLALILAIVFVSGCTSETPSKSDTTINQSSQTTVSQPTQSQTLDLKIGETAKTSKLEVTVFSAQKIKSYDYYSSALGYNLTQQSNPGKSFVLIDAEVKNVGADSAYVGASEFSITDTDGYKYDPTLYYGQSTDGMDIAKQLYTNQKMRGKVLFEVPDSATGLILQYDFGNMVTGTKLASWTIE